jgi:glutaredoxin
VISAQIGERLLGSVLRTLPTFGRENGSFWLLFCCRGAQEQRYNLVVPEPRKVVVYSRKGCHLCEVVKESLDKLSRRGGFIWQEIDVDSDGELRRQFNDEVPVVFIDGRKAFKYRMDEQEFLRKLAG